MVTAYTRNYFDLFSIPYFNELTANQLGFSTQFAADTPNDYFIDSMNQLQRWFQGGRPSATAGVTNPNNNDAWRPGMVIPDGFEITIINGKQVLKRKNSDPLWDTIPKPPDAWKTNPPDDIPIGTPGTQTPENNAKIPTPITDSLSGIFSGDMLGKLIGSDTAIGAGLVLVAIVLIIIGLLSLR